MEKLNREELIDLVRRIRLGEGDDDEVCVWLRRIELSVAHPDAQDIIVQYNEENSAEQIVDELLSYKPIILP